MAIYLKFGKHKGNVTAKGHEDWIDCGSIQFGVGRAISVVPGKAKSREASTPSLSEVSLTKGMDASSPHLFTESVVGKGETAEIHLVRTSENQLETYMEYKLEDAIISGYSVSGSGSDSPSEVISISFTKLEMKYIPYKDDHTKDSPIPAGYDLEKANKI